VTQGSFSPFSQDEGKWGNYFDGVDDYLSVSASGGEFTATSSFSAEAWFYMTVAPTNSTTGAHCIISHWDGTSDPRAWFIDTGNNLDFRVFVYNSSGNPLVAQSGVGSFSLNQWTHVALTWDGSNYRFFVNGSLVFTVNSSTAPNPATSKNVIIGYNTNTHYFPGYISNVRITVDNGAQYTAAFTPPTEPLTAISGTSLLTCQSNRFVDNSSNAHSITVNGDPEVTPFSPFAPSTAYDPATKGGSGYFENGDTDLLSLADSTDFDIYGGDYTVEAWVYADAFNTYNYFLSKGNTTTREWAFAFTSSDVRAYWSTNGAGSGDQVVSASTTNNLNEWFHLAFVKSGNTITIYKNGTSIGSGSFTSIYSGSDPLYISRFMNFTGISHSHDGYIAHLRIVKGTAIAPSGVPTSPPTAVTNTSLLCNFTNAGIYDGTGRNVLETVGDAHVENSVKKYGNSVKKYGTGSMQFDGTGDYLQGFGDLTAMGSGDFTWEFWVYFNAFGTFSGIIDSRLSDGTATNAGLLYVNGTTLTYWSGGSEKIAGSTLSTGQWYHVAAVRNSGTVTLYLNGTSEGSASDSVDMTTPILRIGDTYDNYPLNGYIDDFRITKGVARYTANFTPPEAKLPNL